MTRNGESGPLTERDLDALLGVFDEFRAWMSDYEASGPPATAPGVQMARLRWDGWVQPAVIEILRGGSDD